MRRNFDFYNRQVIPILQPYRCASRFGEDHPHATATSTIPIKDEHYKAKEKEWRINKDLASAIELVGGAIVYNDRHNRVVIEASQFIINESESVSDVMANVARSFLTDRSQQENECDEAPSFFDLRRIYQNISLNKEIIRNYPLDSIAWTDLVYYYCSLGQNEKANECAKAAAAYGRENIFVLRALARYYAHIQEPERALYYLRHAKVTNSNPCLIATEISLAEAFSKTPRKIREGRILLNRAVHSPKKLSELYGTLGTLNTDTDPLLRPRGCLGML